MAKYMFDTNCFYEIGFDEVNILNNDKNQHFASIIQYNEIKERKIDSKFTLERKDKLLQIFSKVEQQELPSESFMLGDSSAGVLGKSKLGTTGFFDIFKKELNEIKLELNNHADALIAEIAIQNKIVLVTNERKLITIIKRHNPELVISLEEFKKRAIYG